MPAFKLMMRRRRGTSPGCERWVALHAGEQAMPSIAQGVHELRIKNAGGQIRVFYFVKFKDAILVFHCFKKKAQKTPDLEIETGKTTFRRNAMKNANEYKSVTELAQQLGPIARSGSRNCLPTSSKMLMFSCGISNKRQEAFKRNTK